MSPSTRNDLYDEQLLTGTARGDLESFRQFYQGHAGRVIAYAYRLCGDRSLAEDVAQEVFTAVWTRAGTYQPDRGGVAPWLYTLTRNKLVDLWRRSGRNRESEELDELRLPQPERDSGDLQITLRQALTKVNPDQRKAIEMAYFQGLTYEETASRLALPLGTLKSRIRLGLRSMREVLEGTAFVAGTAAALR
ncbi:MAG TPA: sigma-70 family RNA polymerase sigma factor [Thermoanaerobaculia bacterium]|nr:sigma-70 family RNA polymerase sigma factor [Thermoanaerobaculia bacterium]